MSNVSLNLATEDENQKKASFFGKGAIISSIILILVLLLYGVLLYMNRDLSVKVSNIQAEYKGEVDKFLVGNGNELMDFGNRSAVAAELITEDQSVTEIFKRVEESILSSVYLNSFGYDKDKKIISLICVGGNLNTIAKQILSFKQDDYFLEVIPGSNSADPESGGMEFEVDLRIK